MNTTTLGSSDVNVTKLCLGTMQFGWTCDESASFEVLDAYAEAGGNFIDTADIYSRWAPGHKGGESEAIIGRWLRLAVGASISSSRPRCAARCGRALWEKA